MRKKIISFIGAFALMAVLLSLSVFAGDEETTKAAIEFTDYGLITAAFEKLKMFFKFFFESLDRIYLTIAGWFA